MKFEPRSPKDEGGSQCGCGGRGCELDRRGFLKLGALAGVGAAFAKLPMMAGPYEPGDFERLVPADKKLDPAWVKSLFARGERTVYRWPDSEKVGMPVGGICCGQLYLGGDGKLWHWDIFNHVVGTGAEHYANPLKPASPLDQGFALQASWKDGEGKTRREVRALDHTGWADIRFTGEYPLGLVEYADASVPVRVSLEAFSPFIPLNTPDSALPVTVMRYTVKNMSATPVTVELAGWLENAVCLHSAASTAGLRRNRIVARDTFTFLECSAEPLPASKRSEPRPDLVFDDFERERYGRWESTGNAFGAGPVAQDQMPAYQGKVGAQGKRLVNSHASAPGKNVEEKDAATGTLLSQSFTVERDYITFLMGGGSHARRTCVNLLVNDQVVLSATGNSDNRMSPRTWDVRPWAGRTARLQIVDQEKSAWGNIGLDEIVFTDHPRTPVTPLERQYDFGTMGLAILTETEPARRTTKAFASLPDPGVPAGLFSEAGNSDAPTSRPFRQKLRGGINRKLELAPAASDTVTFLITWHFPNLQLGGLGDYQGREYGRRFASALAVTEYVAGQFPRLAQETRLWHDTWYDSTLPWWFLDRTLATASHLATNTCYWFGTGRFYAWEGVGCCAGTCTHVWHYAHSMARLFPQLERSAREMVDYGVGFEASTGRIRFRAEHNDHWAVDGQAGCILRVYREHQTSPNDAFLRRLWPRVKQSLEFMIRQDSDRNGIMDGPQHNTLDADWHGQVAWLSGLYLAALRAGEAMAREMGDEEFARQCHEIFERGRKLVDERLFNSEYYFHAGDANRPKTVGSYNGCEIDQVFGDSWAWQVGLGHILNPDNVKTALRSLWRYNFTPDVGPYRKAYPPGRWYAMAGEAGLLMCTWPKGETQRVKESFDYYFNECMTGFEYQVAWHMIAEGMLLEGLAIIRAIHDRYHATRRNPWNEVECGDHYARAMAGYGAFLTACGFEYHGPQGRISFAPRLQPENFRVAFTAAEGWGTFAQVIGADNSRYELELRWGKLRLRLLAFAASQRPVPAEVQVHVGERTVPARTRVNGDRLELELSREVTLHAGEKLSVGW